MRIALTVISIFILVPELYASSLDLQAELSIRRNLEAVLDEPIIHSPTYEDLKPKEFDPEASPYAAPQTALNDRMFVSVEEYPDGYTGYHCSIIGNFRYTLELCSPYVWECIDGKLFKKTCPGSSVFWFDEEICETTPIIRNSSVLEPTCHYNGTHYRVPNWPMKFVHAARVKNETIDPIMITTDCTKVQSGYFAIKECFPGYVSCTGGFIRMEPCSSWGEGKVFDDRIKGCVSMEECKAPLDKFRGIRFPIHPWNDEPETRKYRAQLPEFVPFSVSTDCRRKTSMSYGYEVGRCHQSAVICHRGIPFIQPCSPGKAFSLRKGTCIEKKECEETWDQWSVELMRPSLKTSVAMQKKEPLSLLLRAKETVLVPTVEECAGKKNGRYAMKPCQAEYMRCFMDTGYKMKCSEGFVFSGRFLECVGKEFCQE